MNHLSSYIKQIGDIKSIPFKMLVKLIKKAQRGNSEARHKVVETHQKLIISLAKRYFNRHDPMDLIMAGNVGLLKAINLYDHSKGYRFTTYAGKAINNHILNYIEKNHNIRLPANSLSNHKGSCKQCKEREGNICTKFYKNILPNNNPLRDCVYLNVLGRIPKMTSLDKPRAEGGENLSEVIPSKDSDNLARIQFDILVEKIEPRLKEVLIKTIKGETLSKISKPMKISRERVRQLKTEAIIEIKKLFISVP